MKKYINFRTLFTIICLCALVISLFQLGKRYIAYTKGSSSNDEVTELFGAKPSSKQEILPSDISGDSNPLLEDACAFFADCNFEDLLSINDEIIGWIAIPGTNINYPICQHSDNQYYLEHTSQKESNLVGAIFADYRIEEPFKEYNTILYGHRLLNQTMFSALKTYVEKNAWQECPYIYIATPDTIYVYEIFTAFQGDPDGISYDVGIHTNKKKQQFIDYALSNALYDTGITPTLEDSILTLSTCTGNGHDKRMIVQGMLLFTAPLSHK